MNELSGSVVGIIDDHNSARLAVGRLAAEGYEEVSLLHGEEGRSVLDEGDGAAVGSFLRRMMDALGDELRIRDRLADALSRGASVISVEVDSDLADDVSDILETHGGHDMWRLGEWSQNRVGKKGSGEG